MRRIIKILPLILVYFIVSAKSCNNNDQVTGEIAQNQAQKIRDSITSMFEMDTLNQASLRAYEATARLKLNDLADYLRIMNDSTAGKAFKDKAREMAVALFVYGKKAPDNFSGVVFDSVSVSKGLQRFSDTVYSGQLSVKVQWPYNAGVKGKIHPVKIRTVEIFALKQEKIFGKDTIKVWNVLLGDIH